MYTVEIMQLITLLWYGRKYFLKSNDIYHVNSSIWDRHIINRFILHIQIKLDTRIALDSLIVLDNSILY